MKLKSLRFSFSFLSMLALMVSPLLLQQLRGETDKTLAVPSGPGRRMALVIGNMAYESVSPLKNPVNDARDMTKALKKLGFEVTSIEDADLQKSNKAINGFVDQLEAGDLVVFYYSGHGIGYNGKNYLVPVDARISCLEDIDAFGIQLDRLLVMFNDRQVRTSLLFLDACRNMPNVKLCRGANRTLTTQGLVNPGLTPRGSMIIFATDEGATADDNRAGRNGLFTGELLKFITRPGMTVREIIDSTATGVEIQTNGSQSPARYDKLWGDFQFSTLPNKTVSKTPVVTNDPGVVPAPTPVRTGATSGFVAVQGASFKMGAANRPYNEQPPHDVRVGVFQMSRYEVSVKEWKDYCQATQRPMPTVPDFDQTDPNKTYWENKDRHPITNITWLDAVEYANWLSDRQGLRKAYQIGEGSVEWDRTANGYRLPTEAEWEMAARGNSPDMPYPGSKTELDVAWSQANSDDRTHPVGGKKANELGLFDMSGNVWEWCWDWYDEYYYKRSAKENPTGGETGTMRAMRGGSWLTASNVLTVRRGRTPRTQSTDIGFRLVRSN